MAAEKPAAPRATAPAAPAFERLLPRAESVDAAAAIEAFGLWQRPVEAAGRPHVMLNMVSSVDGSATLGGRSGSLSGSADRALFHALRAAVDGVLVGAGTVTVERYGRIIAAAGTRRLRRERGLSEEPLACIVSGSLGLDSDIPLLAEPQARVVILTPAPGMLAPAPRAQLDYARCEHGGALDLARCLSTLRERFGVETLLCEGGPHLAGQLVAAGLLDELFLSLSPLLAGDEAPGGEQLRILAGAQLDPAVQLDLRDVLRNGSTLFLRYAVRALEPVSRETTLNSSPAS